MATRKSSKAAEADITEEVLQTVDQVVTPQSGVVKEYVQNGMRYQRIRTEKGDLVDVRI